MEYNQDFRINIKSIEYTNCEAYGTPRCTVTTDKGFVVSETGWTKEHAYKECVKRFKQFRAFNRFHKDKKSIKEILAIVTQQLNP